MKKMRRKDSFESIERSKDKNKKRKFSEQKPKLDKRSNSMNLGYKIPTQNPRLNVKNSPTRLEKKDAEKTTVYEKWLKDVNFYASKEQNISLRKASDNKHNKNETKKVKVDRIYPVDN